MKSLLTTVITSAILFTGSVAYCKDAKPVTGTKEIALTSAFQNISVGNNLDVVLTNDAAKSSISVSGNEKYLSSLSVNIHKGILYLSSNKDLKHRVTIYVPVAALTSMEVASGASVATEGTLKQDNVKVLVHDGGKISMKVLGNLKIESTDDCDFVYETYEKEHVVYVKQ